MDREYNWSVVLFHHPGRLVAAMPGGTIAGLTRSPSRAGMRRKGARVQITVTVPDELATRLQSAEKDLPEILALGIRAWNARRGGSFSGLANVFETLASLPAPEEIL